MKGMCVEMLCLLGVAMVMGGVEETPQEGSTPLAFVLEELLDDQTRGIVTNLIEDRCRQVLAEHDVPPPPPPPPPTPSPVVRKESNRRTKLKSKSKQKTYSRKSKKTKRSADEKVPDFCRSFMEKKAVPEEVDNGVNQTSTN